MRNAARAVACAHQRLELRRVERVDRAVADRHLRPVGLAVVLLRGRRLVVAVLEERLACGAAPAGSWPDAAAGRGPITATLRGSAAVGAALADAQERLVRRLRGPGPRGPRAAKAVVTVDASDQSQAVAEATAAVEAMV